MNFHLDISVPALTVFVQGLLSFFSPCVFPLVPLYIGYFSGGAKTVDADGNVRYPRGRVLLHTVFFVLGVSAAFFLLGFGFTALGQFLSAHQRLFARLSGVIMILFGLYQLGVFGRSAALEKERRLPFRLDKVAMGPLTAWLLGFTFSFAWTPCVGPTLSSVLLLAGSAGNAAKGLGLICLYTFGFILPFLAVGLFTGAVLGFFRRHQGVVRYTVRIGALLMMLMGVLTLTGLMNNLTGYLSRFDGLFTAQAPVPEVTEAPAEATEIPTEAPTETPANPTEAPTAAKEAAATPEKVFPPDFRLADQYGNTHTLSDYQGKTVFLNFWATWCPPCRAEMPEIQQLYEDYGRNEGDLIVLGVAAPDYGSEGSLDEVKTFLDENGYTFPVVMDQRGAWSYLYGIRAYPTTFMISADGSLYGYIEGALTGDIMRSIVQQTMENEPTNE